MDNIFFVHIFNSTNDLLHDILDFVLPKANLLLLKSSVKIFSEERFHHKVNVFLINEEGVELDDIRVIQVALDLDLSDEIVFLVFLDGIPRDNLDAVDDVGLDLLN